MEELQWPFGREFWPPRVGGGGGGDAAASGDGNAQPNADRLLLYGKGYAWVWLGDGDGLVLVSYTSQASIFIVSFYICDISSLRFIDVFAARCAPDYFGKPHFECV